MHIGQNLWHYGQVNDELETKTYSVEIDYDPVSGKIISERWRNQNGKFDRPCDLPAYIQYCPDTGIPIHQRWHDGIAQQRMNDKPAVIVTNSSTGSIVVESYEIMNQCHREGDKPALIYRDESGNLIEESYWQHGKCHRNPSLGPAKIYYDEVTGEKSEIEYWFNGIQIDPPQAEQTLDI